MTQENTFDSGDMQTIAKASFPVLIKDFISLAGTDFLAVVKHIFTDGVDYES